MANDPKCTRHRQIEALGARLDALLASPGFHELREAHPETAREIESIRKAYAEGLRRNAVSPVRVAEVEAKYRTLFGSLADGAFLMGETFLDCNRRACAMWRCSREDILGKTPLDFSPPRQPDGTPSAEAARTRIGRALAGAPQVFPWRHVRFDGTPMDAEISLAAVPVEGRVCLLGTMRDLTARKEAEIALRRREEEFRVTFEYARDAILWADPETGDILQCNRAAETLLERDRSEILRLNQKDLHPPEDTEAHCQAFRSHVADEGDSEMETEVLTGTGRRVPVRISASLNEMGGRRVMVGVFRDITEGKAQETALAARLRYENGVVACTHALLTVEGRDDAVRQALAGLLAASQASRVYLFENVEDPDDGLCMRQVYEACEPGVTPEIDNPDLQHLPYSEGFGRWAEVLGRGEAIRGPVAGFPPRERAILAPQGIVSILVLPVFVNRTWWGFLGFDETAEERDWDAEDVDLLQSGAAAIGSFIARRRLEDELRRARDTAENASRSKSAFLANMSHEIRTPLSGVLGLTELMLHTDLSERQREYAVSAAASARSLLAIVDEILDFSRIEADRLVLREAPFNLEAVVREAAYLLGHQAREKGVRLIVHYAPAMPRWLEGDAGRLRQSILNLAGNALKFTETGHVRIEVRPDTPASSSGCAPFRIRVADTGIGIAVEEQARIFETFTQADTTSTRPFGGTGLGLAITRRILERMGGRIELASAPGKGSAFSLSLALPVLPEEDRVDRPLDVDRRGRVLVVSRHEEERAFLGEYLDAWGLAREEATGTETARARLGEAASAHKDRGKDDPFTAVIVVEDAPAVDGEALARGLRDEGIEAPPLLLLGWTSEGRGRKRLEPLGVMASLLLPLCPWELREALAEAHHARRAGRRPAWVTGQRPGQCGHADGGESEGSGPMAIRPGVRVLLAEDNRVNQMVLRAFLERLGCRLKIVPDGAEAVARAAEGGLDLILMDCHMPDMDGFEATRRIRTAETESTRLPIIALTASAMPEDRARCLEAGMDEHIAKPVGERDLAALLFRYFPDTAPATNTNSPSSSSEAIGDGHDAGSAPFFDLDRLERATGGDADLTKRLLQIFWDDAFLRTMRLREALEKNDLETARREAHTLKGAAYNVGARALGDASDALDTALREEGGEAIQAFDPRVHALEDAFAEVEPFLRARLDGSSSDEVSSKP